MSIKDPLAESVLKSSVVYKGRFLQLVKDDVRTPDGILTSREYLHHPGASAMIAMFDDGKVILERQYRHPLRRSFLEFPAGKIDAGESPLNCAKRELIEETGYKANTWLKLGRFNNAIGYSDEEITVFLAKDLQMMGQHLDIGENLELIEMPWQSVVQMCLTGEITDVKTIVGAFWLQNYMNGTKSNETLRCSLETG